MLSKRPRQFTGAPTPGNSRSSQMEIDNHPDIGTNDVLERGSGAPTQGPENKRMELTTANRDLAVAIDRGRSSSVERWPAARSQ